MRIASIITAILALFTFGALLWHTTPREERGTILFCLIATMPMCWLMFHQVRLPLDRWLESAFGSGAALRWARTAYAPLTEEPAKLWPLMLPFIRRAITPASAGRFALALGLGFALGEIFTVAGLVVAKSPQIAGLPWYKLEGFFVERMMTCAIHPGMTAVALACWRRTPVATAQLRRDGIARDRRSAHGFGGLACGLALAMLAHYLANFPISMAQRGWFGPNAVVSQLLVFLWVVFCFFAAVAWLIRLLFPHTEIGLQFFGEAVCPECGRRYVRDLFLGANFGFTRRYERCPHCKNWHWTERLPQRPAA